MSPEQKSPEEHRSRPPKSGEAQRVTPTSRENAMLREEQKKRGQYPLHDEPIGGA